MATQTLVVSIGKDGCGCNSCSAAAILLKDKTKTVDGTGIIHGSFVPNLQGHSIYQAGCDTYGNFQYSDTVIVGSALPAYIPITCADVDCVACGCTVELVKRSIVAAAAPFAIVIDLCPQWI